MIELLALTPTAPGRFVAEIPATMAQGRSTFGGFVAALAVRAAERVVGAGRPLRSLLVQFAGPVAPGSVEVQVTVLRAGRALSQVEARVLQGGEVCLLASMACGAARPTRLAWPAAPAPTLPPLDELPALPYLEGVTPTFTQHFAYRWVRGGVPFSGAAEPGFTGLIRPRVGGVDTAMIVAMLDAWPLPVLPLATRVVPASSVTWMVNLVGATEPAPAGPTGPPDPAAWWCCDVAAVASGEGYVDVDTKLWGLDGRLVATSRQLAAEFSG